MVSKSKTLCAPPDISGNAGNRAPAHYGVMMTVNPRFDVRDLLVAVMINIVWGLNIIAVKFSLQSIPPFSAALLRQALILLACIGFLKVVPGRMRSLIALGIVVGGVFLVFTNLSVSVTTNLGALAIAGQLGAPFSLILAIVFLGERIGLTRVIGIGMAVAGCAMLVFDPAIVKETLGMCLMIVASFCWAVGSLLQRQLAGVPVRTIYAWVGLVGVIMLGPVAIAVEPDALRDITTLPSIALGGIVFSALGSTLLGHGGMSWLLQRHPVSTVIPLTLVTPVISVVASALVFETPITPIMVAGGALALAGVAIVTMRTAAKGEEQVQT
jgi:O-acetylserine/cysteine efflux transporter